MAYDLVLADRIRTQLSAHDGVSERKMFGGIAFMFHGNMALGVLGDEIMVRVGPDAYATMLAEPHAREMDFTGRPMRGFVSVDAAGIAEDDDLAEWIRRGMDHAGSLPPK